MNEPGRCGLSVPGTQADVLSYGHVKTSLHPATVTYGWESDKSAKFCTPLFPASFSPSISPSGLSQKPRPLQGLGVPSFLVLVLE